MRGTVPSYLNQPPMSMGQRTSFTLSTDNGHSLDPSRRAWPDRRERPGQGGCGGQPPARGRPEVEGGAAEGEPGGTGSLSIGSAAGRAYCLLLDTGHLRGRHVRPGHGRQAMGRRRMSPKAARLDTAASHSPVRPWLRSGSFWGRTSRSTLPRNRSTSCRSEPGCGATLAIISQKCRLVCLAGMSCPCRVDHTG